MATNYPGGLDSLTNPSSGDALDSPSHAGQHTNANDAIEAIETELGTDPSGGSATVKARFEVIEANDWVTAARIAADAVGSSEIAADAVGSSELADSAVDTAAIADGAVTPAKMQRQVGNLLTENQASVETDTTGWAGYILTVARSTAQALHGSASLLVTRASGGGGSAYTPTGVSGIPVTPGETYTATASFRAATGTPDARVGIGWYTSGGAVISQPVNAYTATSSSWRTEYLTAVAPANAAYAGIEVGMPAGTAGDAYYADCFSLHRGAAGVWSLPGYPVVGQSRIAVNDAVDLSGTGTPEGVITAAPGSTWLQTDSTTDVKGWIRWVKATGTGNTGWVAGPESDTGWRDIESLLGGSWTATTLRMRRVGPTVHVEALGLTGDVLTTQMVTLPSGFTGPVAAYMPALGREDALTGKPAWLVGNSNGLNLYGGIMDGTTWLTTHAFSGSWTFLTSDAWPTSNPGSPA